MTKQRRWLMSAIEASKTEGVCMPWQRATKTRPLAFKHIQMQVAPKTKALAAR